MVELDSVLFKMRKDNENILFKILYHTIGFKYNYEEGFIMSFNISNRNLFLNIDDAKEINTPSTFFRPSEVNINVVFNQKIGISKNYFSLLRTTNKWNDEMKRFNAKQRATLIEISNFLYVLRTSGIELIIPDIQHIIYDFKNKKQIIHVVAEKKHTKIVIANIPAFLFCSQSFINKTLPATFNRALSKANKVNTYIDSQQEHYQAYNSIFHKTNKINMDNNIYIPDGGTDVIYKEKTYIQTTTPLYLLIDKNINGNIITRNVALYHSDYGFIAEGNIKIENNEKTKNILNKYWNQLDGYGDNISNIGLHPIVQYKNYSRYIPVYFVLSNTNNNKTYVGLKETIFNLDEDNHLVFDTKYHKIDELPDSRYINPNIIFLNGIKSKLI